jgi:hypothetical protein
MFSEQCPLKYQCMFFHFLILHARKWQGLRQQCICIKFHIKLGVKWYTHFQNDKSSMWTANSGKNISMWVIFSSSKALWSLLKVLNMWDLYWQAKQMKVCIHMSLKTEESLPMKLITGWEFLLGESGTFWKWTWTCVRLLPNSWGVEESCQPVPGPSTMAWKSLRIQSQVMRHGFKVMTHIPNNSHLKEETIMPPASN